MIMIRLAVLLVFSPIFVVVFRIEKQNINKNLVNVDQISPTLIIILVNKLIDFCYASQRLIRLTCYIATKIYIIFLQDVTTESNRKFQYQIYF